MPTSHFKDLQCWQLANRLRVEVVAICDRDRVARDGDFCTSFRSASSSVCRNIAEGFGRFGSAEIVMFFRYALASLAEVQDHLQECRDRRFIESAEFERLWETSEHVKAKTLKFMRSHEARARYRAPRRRG